MPSFDLSGGWQVSPRSDRSRNPFQRKTQLALKHPEPPCHPNLRPPIFSLGVFLFSSTCSLLELMYFIHLCYIIPKYTFSASIASFIALHLFFVPFRTFVFPLRYEARSEDCKREKEQTANKNEEEREHRQGTCIKGGLLWLG